MRLFSKKKTIENLKKLSYIDISRYDLCVNFNLKFSYKFYDSFKISNKTCLIHLRKKLGTIEISKIIKVITLLLNIFVMR